MFPLQAQRQKLQCHQYYIPWALPDGGDLQIYQLPSSKEIQILRGQIASLLRRGKPMKSTMLRDIVASKLQRPPHSPVF